MNVREPNPKGRYYPARETTLEIDIVEDHAVLRESLCVWLEANAPGIRVVRRYGSWAEFVSNLDTVSDVVILDVLLGDRIPLAAKSERSSQQDPR